MFVQTVLARVLPGAAADFEAGLCEVRQRVFASPGYRGFEVAQGIEDGATYLVQVRWESSTELLEHVEQRFERCWAPVRPFLEAPLHVTHLVERPGLGLSGPGVVTDLAWLRESPAGGPDATVTG